MSKMKKKFMALLIVFTSIISFLPVGFSGQAANADAYSDAKTIRVNITGEGNKLPLKVDAVTGEKIYSTTELVTSSTKGFDLTVKDVRVDKVDGTVLIQQAINQGADATGIVDQKVKIVSINGTPISDPNHVFTDLGISVVPIEGSDPVTGEKVIGQRIIGLPFGVNKIEYDVLVGTQTATFVPTYGADGKTIIKRDATLGALDEPQNTSSQQLTIEHATSFVTEQISELKFKSYIGDPGQFSSNDDIVPFDNNKEPFLYEQTAEPDPDMPLRYTFDLPDSTNMLKYIVNFRQDITNALVYKNGEKDTTSSVTGGKTLVGSLAKMGDSALIVLKTTSNSSSGAIDKSYAIEIRYKALVASEDYSLRDAGITKLNFNEDSSVAAYIGKKFVVDTTNSFKTYKGDIYIDPKAGEISISPILVKSPSTVGYVVTNNYTNSGGSSGALPSHLASNGKQCINFMQGNLSNTIQVDVYKGSNGTVTDSSTILARYSLTVHLVEGSSAFSMNLKFDNDNANDNTKLKQPGTENEVEYSMDRRTYDLYTQDANKVNISASFGADQDNKTYIRVWVADDTASDDLTEAAASLANVLDSNNLRKTNLDIAINSSNKKIVVQAYHDKFETQTVNGVKTDVLTGSYPVGDKYVFYLPANFTDTDITKPSEDSTNAFLSSIKIKGYTLTDSDGNTGFSKTMLDYTTTVTKTDTSEKITVISEDPNAKSIVATINGSDQTYDLFSGEENELPLDSSGKTTIKIVVTAQDGTTTKTYNVVIKNNSKSSNVNLKNVILNVGDYTFDPKVTVTKVRVDQNVTSIQVTPIPEEPKSKTSVNGEEYSGTPIAVSLKGNQKTTINIEVVSEDGSMSKTYTLEIYRVDYADWNDNNSNNNTDTDDQFYDEYNDCWVDLSKYDEWGTVNGKPAYFDKNSRQVKNAWITTGKKNYYLDNLGFRASGWKIDGPTGKSYYLDPSTGEMRTGWINLNNTWYYLGLNGVMHKGWLYLNGKWYYFTPNGQMVINQTMYVDDKLCVFGQDGALIY